MITLWIPKWLGECYSKLYMKFKLGLFTFNDAKNVLLFDDNKLSVVFSMLHSKRLILVFKKSRPRIYRLIDPENMVFIASGMVKNFDKVKQEAYLKLILDCLRLIMENICLESFAIYGSVARGTTSNTSDVDILLISDDFHGTIASRIDSLIKIEEKLRDELNWLRKNGIYTGLSFYPLRKVEAEKLPLLFLDLTEEAIVLYDKNSFLERILLNFKSKLIEINAKRIFINKKFWYWDLKPNYKFGEKIEID
ncbi:MAG: nucleotidyltransferase domain-containing protein [Candidatus Methanomethylicia archaeon]